MMHQDNDIAAIVESSRCLYGGGATLGHGDDIARFVMLSITQEEAKAIRLRPGGMIHRSRIVKQLHRARIRARGIS